MWVSPSTSNRANLVPFVFSSEVSNTDPEPESLDDNEDEDKIVMVAVDSAVASFQTAGFSASTASYRFPEKRRW